MSELTESTMVETDKIYEGGDCPNCESDSTSIVFSDDMTSTYSCESCGFEFVVKYKLATIH
jgi:transposase-like protein